MSALIPTERIERRIYLIRGQKVMIDEDLAEMYEVEVSQLTRQVRRNPLRFPSDFGFQLTIEEWEILKCQNGISRSTWGGRRHPPYAFSEQGVSMLASVLTSERAALVNVAIIRVFVRLREMLASHKELLERLKELESHLKTHDKQILNIFEAIRQLMSPPAPREEKHRIGYRIDSGTNRMTAARK